MCDYSIGTTAAIRTLPSRRPPRTEPKGGFGQAQQDRFLKPSHTGDAVALPINRKGFTMSKFIRWTLLAVTLAAVIGTPHLAHASRIRSVVDRRQHPNGQFFEKSTSHHVSASRPIMRPLSSVRSR